MTLGCSELPRTPASGALMPSLIYVTIQIQVADTQRYIHINKIKFQLKKYRQITDNIFYQFPRQGMFTCVRFCFVLFCFLSSLVLIELRTTTTCWALPHQPRKYTTGLPMGLCRYMALIWAFSALEEGNVWEAHTLVLGCTFLSSSAFSFLLALGLQFYIKISYLQLCSKNLRKYKELSHPSFYELAYFSYRNMACPLRRDFPNLVYSSLLPTSTPAK